MFRPLELAWLDADYADLEGEVISVTGSVVRGKTEVQLPSYARPPKYSRHADAIPLARAESWEAVDKLLRRNYDILEPRIVAAAWKRLAELGGSGGGEKLLPRLTRLTREMLPDMGAR